MSGRTGKHLLVLVLSLTLLVGCGGGQGEESQTAALSESVDLVVLEGPGSLLAGNLPGDYHTDVLDSLEDVEAEIIGGSYDLAILPANTAAYLYNRTGEELAALSPVSLNGWKLVTQGDLIEEGQISGLQGKTIISSSQGGTGEALLRLMLSENGINPDYGVHWQWVDTTEEIQEALSAPGTVALIQEPMAQETLERVDGTKAPLSLDNLFEDRFGFPVPSDVLVVSQSFLEERKDDIPAILSDMNQALEKSQKKADNLVFFPDSNRGMMILKAYDQQMAAFDLQTLGGELPQEDYYFGTGE